MLAYSVNLVLLAVLVAGKITEQQLFPGRTEPVDDWRRIASLWRSRLPREGWENLLHVLELHWGWDGDRRVLRLRMSETTIPYTTHSDSYWSYNFGPGHTYRQSGSKISWVEDDPVVMQAQSHFLCDVKDDIVAHALEPFWGDLGTMVTTFHDYWEGRVVSAAHALITLWITATQEKGPAELAAAYDTCLMIAIHGFAPNDVDTRARFRTHVFRRLATDFHRLPGDWLADAVQQIKNAEKSTQYEGRDLVRMANEIIPELMADDSPHLL